MNTRRLAILAAHLERIEATPLAFRIRGFDMHGWSFDTTKEPTIAIGTLARPTNVCGTAACAFGEATMIPELHAEGLELHDGIPMFECTSGFVAAAVFFDMEYAQAFQLFAPSQYATEFDDPEIRPGMVAHRIRMLIARHENKMAREVAA